MKSAMAVQGDGRTSAPASNDGKGRVYSFGGNGDDIRQVVPPPGFNPLTASDQALATFGFEARPADSAGLAHWKSLYANYHVPTDVPTMCKTVQNNSHTTSHNWSGAVNNGATFNQVQLGWAQTAFDAVCAHASGYTTWAGLGGFYDIGSPGNKRLAQTGSGVSISGGLNTIFPFWEVLNSSYATNSVAYGHYINPGDSVYSSVDWNGTSFTFRTIDTTIGTNDPVIVSSAGGQPARNFYDGTTADYITEQPGGGSAPGGLYYLRKPHLGNTLMFWEHANLAPLEQWGRFGIDELSSDNAHYVQTTTFGSTQNFYDIWQSCS